MKKNIRYITIPALLAAVSILLSYFEFPIVPGFSFLKLDFAEVPIILCGMLTGPVAAICAEAVRSLIALFLTGTASAGVGTAFNFIMGSAFVLLYHGYLRLFTHRGNTWAALAAASLLGTVVACLLNFFAAVPVYKAIGMFPKDFSTAVYVLTGALPFNLIKWPLCAALAGVICQSTKGYLQKERA